MGFVRSFEFETKPVLIALVLIVFPLLLLGISPVEAALFPFQVGKNLRYSRTDSLNNSWNVYFTTIGQESIDSVNYFILRRFNYNNDGTAQYMVMRSTDDEVYLLEDGEDSLLFRSGTPGETWTVGDEVTTIMPSEQVTVPYGGPYTATVYRKNESGSTDYWYEYLVPGFSVVKEVDYNTSNAPNVQQLVSISELDVANFANYSPATYGSYWTYQNANNPSDIYTISVFETFSFDGHPAVKIGTDSNNYMIYYNNGTSVSFYGVVDNGVLYDKPDVTLSTFSDGMFYQVGSPTNFQLLRMWDNIDPNIKAAYGIDPMLEDLILVVTFDSNYQGNSHNSMVGSNLGVALPNYAVTDLEWYRPGIGKVSSMDIQAATGAIQSRYSLTGYNIVAGFHRLTLTVVSDVALKGGGYVYGDGELACYNTGSDQSEQWGVCFADFLPGTTVSLHQSPDSNSTWATWSESSCGTADECQIVMNGPKSVTATFPYAYKAKVSSSGNRYDSLVQAAVNSSSTDSILTRAVTISEDFNLANKIITLSGGLTPWYLPQNDWTTLQGKLTIQSGALTVDRLVIK